MSSLVGRTLGQYEIIDVLGRGGMATVYLGKQTSIDRMVAIKVLPPHPALDEGFKERFQLEAKTIGNLQNPNILPLYDYGTFEDVIYLVMAYVDGGTLEDRMDSGPMDIREVERILRPVASALDYAHNQGVIHRDVKPANILMQNEHPLLADFGMVKMVTGDSNLTGTAIVGTPTYMAPEQGQGLTVDRRADVYALGAILYEMLTGARVYDGETPMQLILAHINQPTPDIQALRPDLNDEFKAIIDQALAKNPDERYATAGALAEAFSKAIHKNSDSLTEVQRAMPIADADSTSAGATQMRTKVLHNTVTGSSLGAGGGGGSDSSTDGTPPSTQIIVRDSVNPLVLMGGFGLIALVIVIVAVLLINNGGNNNILPVAEPTTADIVVDVEEEATESEATTVAPEPTAVPALPAVDIAGDIRFTTESTLGDRAVVNLRDAIPPTGDTLYAVWLTNTTTDAILLLGEIAVEGTGEGTLIYTDADGNMLPALYNRVIVTAETELGDTPSANIVYEAALPIEVSTALNEIFVASESGLSGGSLLDGAQTETRFAAQHAGLAANASNIGGVRVHAEHTINIINGEEEDYDGSGSGSNPGRGIGVYFFLDAIDEALVAATSSEDATPDLQANAEFIRVCTFNVRTWADEVVALELEMISAEDIESISEQLADSTVLVEQMQTGVDLNQNGVVEAFESECGLEQIPDFGLQFARMDLVATEGDS